MKSSSILASLLFGAFAVAAPLDSRHRKVKTEVVVETVTVYTTVYVDYPVAEATTTSAGNFSEQANQTSSASANISSSHIPVVTPIELPKPSSVYVAPTQVPTSSAAPSPSPVETPKPVEVPEPVETPSPVEAPEPITSAAYVAPEPATSAAYVAPAPVEPSAAPAPPAPAPVSAPVDTSTSGERYEDVDITIYHGNGAYGACGNKVYDTEFKVAIATTAWGASTYDVMTGESTNPWCGQKIRVFYNGNSIDAVIDDMCPGCSGHDIDLTVAAWDALTGREMTRLKASWVKLD